MLLQKANGLSHPHFLNTADLTQEEIQALIALALDLKQGKVQKSLAGKTLATLFFNPSVRTRVSFATAMFKLGGQALEISSNNVWSFEYEDDVVMDGSTIEHVKEVAPVLSRYCDGLAIRCSELVTRSAESASTGSWAESKRDIVLNSFAKYAGVPVINMESNVYHPCQGLGDAVTIKEQLGETKGKKYVHSWAYHPKALPMATTNSQLLGACDLGMDVVLAHPQGWELDPEILALAQKRAIESGGSFSISYDQHEAVEDADIVCTKSWGALPYYGNWEAEKQARAQLKDWIIDEEKMARTRHGKFMHCLPVRRNVEVTQGVLDGTSSIVIDEAENRMWAQMALLATYLGD
ncbi:N-acetylornithine carbamoyltransferase [Dictyobacter kobayashii]|uniref:N-acetylornithine carbamoyltransferase n=1 Tax=Dictyobacter kobayashii TaxID=2014872 RepID=A0A402AFC3_9CHLR|nr:N-acetylornithine carbamoyltransferase [Dictyobacter kobayashii]GCE17772.1 N-acetylornithine carbamoyltransferase [Dictyobacter kobayashii]